MKTFACWAAGLTLLAAVLFSAADAGRADDPKAGGLLTKETADALIKADAESLADALSAAKPAKNMIKKAKAAAVLIAAYAQDQLGDKANAQQAATVRDAALKALEAVENDKFADAKKIAEGIKAGMKADPAAKVAPVDLAGKTDIEIAMVHFKPAKGGGQEIEKKIEDGKTKATKAQLPEFEKLAAKTAILAQLTDSLKPAGAKPNWNGWAKDMKDASLDALKAAKAGKDMDVKKALGAVSTSCTNCHNEYRK